MNFLKSKTTILLLVIAIAFTSCNKAIVPSGVETTKEFSFSDYNQLDISNAIEAFVEFSDTEESITIKADDNIIEYFRVEKSGDKLFIELDDNLNFNGEVTLSAYIKTKNINSFIGSGASRILLSNSLSTDNLMIDLSGASQMKGNVSVTSLTADLSGASSIQLSGNTDKLNIESSGASSFEDFDLDANVIRAEISGASQIKVTVNSEIYLEASGASALSYKGEPVVQENELSGASTLIKVD